MENKTNTEKDDITLRELLAIFVADIDIFLLQDESQTKDNDKIYTKEEIREQLHRTMDKFVNLPIIHPQMFDLPLFSALSYKFLKNAGFSEKEIKDAKKQAKQ
jgi:hypothetical protein